MSKTTWTWAKTNGKDGQNTTIFSITERKTSIQILLSMTDEESRSARKRMWKIICGVFIVFFLNNLLTSSVQSLQGNLRPRP